jgi:hypothetical protein
LRLGLLRAHRGERRSPIGLVLLVIAIWLVMHKPAPPLVAA